MKATVCFLAFGAYLAAIFAYTLIETLLFGKNVIPPDDDDL